MYKPRYIQYINLPKVPAEILQKAVDNIPTCLEKFERPNNPYTWTDFDNTELDAWGKLNISQELYYAFQIMTDNMKIHKDTVTKTKFCYVIQTGGENVITSFYDEDQTTILDTYCIEQDRWHLLKADTYHGVSNLNHGNIRFSITAKIFE